MASNITKLVLDTQFAINNSKTDPVWSLNRQIDLVEGYCISNFNGVNTLPNISDRNDKFSFIEGLTNTSGTLYTTSNTITLPHGNYTIDSFIDMFNTQLNASAGNVYTLTNNTLENLLTLTLSSVSSGNTQNNFNIQQISNNIYYELSLTNQYLNTTLSQQITFPETYDLSGIQCLHLASSSFGYGYNKLAGNALNIVLSVPVDVAYMGQINFHNESIFVSSDTNNLQTIQLNLYDDRLRKINSDMRDWNISLYIKSN